MRQGTADKWAAFFGIPVREEEEYVHLQEICVCSPILCIPLENITAPELYEFVQSSKRDNAMIWGIVPPYTGSDDFAGRLFHVVSRGRKAYWSVEQQRRFRQHLRLVAVIPQ